MFGAGHPDGQGSFNQEQGQNEPSHHPRLKKYLTPPRLFFENYLLLAAFDVFQSNQNNILNVKIATVMEVDDIYLFLKAFLA